MADEELMYCENCDKDTTQTLVNIGAALKSRVFKCNVCEGVFRTHVATYEEAGKVLDRLHSKDLEMIIISNSPREFLNLEIIETEIKDYFKHTFSSVSDFKEVKKSIGIYKRISKILNVNPRDIVHVGDNWELDFLVPRKVGITSFYLNRHGMRTDEFMVENLEQFSDILERLG